MNTWPYGDNHRRIKLMKYVFVQDNIIDDSLRNCLDKDGT